jgi:hypothetical protein
VRVREQCKILSVTRSTLNSRPVGESKEDMRIPRIMDEIYLENPCVGSRRLLTLLERDHGILTNRKRIMGLQRDSLAFDRLGVGCTFIFLSTPALSLGEIASRNLRCLVQNRHGAHQLADRVALDEIKV